MQAQLSFLLISQGELY